MAIILQDQKGVEGERTKMKRTTCSVDLYLSDWLMYPVHKMNAII